MRCNHKALYLVHHGDDPPLAFDGATNKGGLRSPGADGLDLAVDNGNDVLRCAGCVKKDDSTLLVKVNEILMSFDGIRAGARSRSRKSV